MEIRRAASSLLDRALCRRLAPFTTTDWQASAVIIAPHPDDETLGCGGVACKKNAAGADVRFVFVTDGSASHQDQFAEGTLRRMRAEEALEAIRRLGGRAEDAVLLGVPDGRAADYISHIAEEIGAILARWHPESVYVVHGGDPPSDHAAVHRAASQAILAYGRRLTIYEYPVWYWYHWPWIPLRGDLPGMWRTSLRQTMRTAAGLLSLTKLNAVADISDVKGRKGAALAAHRSQMERPEGHRAWPILADLGRGDFLARLVCDCELFRRYEANVQES